MKNFKRTVAVLLAVMLVVTAVPVVSFAQTTPEHYSDFPTGWSYAAMESAIANSLIHGFGDGSVRPQSLLTRAEMAAIINRAFGAETKADIEQKYHDVLPEHWFYDDISKAVKMKTFEGMSSSIMSPDAPITRQDAMLVIARALVHGAKDTSVLNKFADKSDIADYAANEIAALVARGYVNGYGDGTLLPKNNITREEFAQLMHNIFVAYDRRDGEFSLGNTDGNVILTGDHIILKDSVINGDLIIGDGVHDTTIEFKNVKVTGRIIFRGGSSKVYFDGFELGGLLVTNDMNEDISGPIYFYHYSYEEHFEDAVYNTSAKFIDKTIWGGSASGKGLTDNDTATSENPTDAATGGGSTTSDSYFGTPSGPSGPATPVTYTVKFEYNTVAGEALAGTEPLTITVNQNATIPAASFPTITKAYHDQQKTNWYVDANANKKYDSGEQIVTTTTAIASDLTLRPMWDAHHKILLEVKSIATDAASVWELYIDQNGAIEPGQKFPKTDKLPQANPGEVKGWFQDLNGDGIKDANEPYIVKGTDDGTAFGTITNNFVNMPNNATTSFVAYKEYKVTFTYLDETGAVLYTKTYNNVPHGSSVAIPTEQECPGADWYDGTNKITTATIDILGAKQVSAATRMLKVTFYDAGSTGYEVVGGPYEVPFGTVVNEAFIAAAEDLNPIRTTVKGYVANNTNIHSDYPDDYTHTVSYEWYRATRESGKFTLCNRLTSAGYKVLADADFYNLKANMQIGLSLPSVMSQANGSFDVAVDSKTNLTATILDTLYNNKLKGIVSAVSTKAYDKITGIALNTNLAGYDINYAPFTKDASGNFVINNVTYKYKLLDFLGASTVDTLIEDSISHMLDDAALRHDIIIQLLKEIAEEGETHGTDGELITKFDNIMMGDAALLAKIKAYAKDYAKKSADYVNTTYVGDAIEAEIDTWIDEFVPESAFDKEGAKNKVEEFVKDYVKTHYSVEIENTINSKADEFIQEKIAANEAEVTRKIIEEIRKEFVKKINEYFAANPNPVVVYPTINTIDDWKNSDFVEPEDIAAYEDAEAKAVKDAYGTIVAAIEDKAWVAIKSANIPEKVKADLTAIAVDAAIAKVDDAFVSNAYETVKTNALKNLKNAQPYKGLAARVVDMLKGTATEVIYEDTIDLGDLDVNFDNITINDAISFKEDISFDVDVDVTLKIEWNGTTIEATRNVKESFSQKIDDSYAINETFDVSKIIDLGTYKATYSIKKSWVHGKIDAKVDEIFADQAKRRSEIIKLAGNPDVREEIDKQIDSIIAGYSKDSDIMQELINVAHQMYQTQIDAFKYSLAYEDQFVFDDDDAFIVDAMHAKLQTVKYEDYKNNFPQAIRTLLGGDEADGGELKVIFDNALDTYFAQVDAAYNGINAEGYNGTPVYNVDTYVMVSINPVEHLVVAAFNDYVENELKAKLDTNTYWFNNPYAEMFEDKLTYTMFVTADPSLGGSGYRLNTVEEIYNEIYKVAVLAHDVGNYFIENISEAELDSVIDFAADAISGVYEKIANKITVLSSGTPVSIKNKVMDLVQKFMGKDNGKIWRKTLLDAVPYLDVVYVKAINKVVSVLGFDASEMLSVNVVSGNTVQLTQGSKVATKTADEIAGAIVSAGLGTKTGNGVVNVKGKSVDIGSIITKLSDKFGTNFQFAAEDTTEAGKAHASADYLCAYKLTLKTSAHENYIYFRVKRG